MNSIGNIIGEICRIVIPINEEIYFGNSRCSVAVCTLSSIGLLKALKDSGLIHDVAVIGRLFSENKGIDNIIRYVNHNHNIKKIILCGKEVWGHKAGHALIKLHKNGVDDSKRIIGSVSPEPLLTVTQSEIEYFQKNVDLINMIGEINYEKILASI